MTCPTHKQLEEFQAGTAPSDTSHMVSAHLETCEVCRNAVESLSQKKGTLHVGPLSSPKAEIPPVSACEPAPLRQLGEYQLSEKLGEGGMGVVYRALHTELDRVVAVKLLTSVREGDDQAIARFQREIKVIGRLDHPHIVRAFDARQIGDTRFLVMEFVVGVNLAELIERVGPLRVADVCEIGCQVADGLEYACRHGLVHRDLKPSNLMLDRAGVVKILDLGLARFQEGQPVSGAVTVDRVVLGTPDFMAPEQATDSRKVDIRADLYSLGCTLFFLLTNQTPFDGPDYGTVWAKIHAHLHEAAPSLAKYRRDVPSGLVTAIGKLLEKNPIDRYGSPRELMDTLQPLATGSDLRGLAQRAAVKSPTLSPGLPPTLRERVKPTSRRRTRWVALLLGSALVVTAFLGVFWLCRRPPGSPREQTPPTLPPPTPSPSPDRSTDWIVMSWPHRGAGRSDLWLFRPDGKRRIQLTNDPATLDLHPAFSPDGRQIAFIRGSDSGGPNSLWVCTANGSDARQIVKASTSSERFLSPVWASTSRLCYVRDPAMDRRPDMEFWEVDPSGGSPKLVFRIQDSSVGGNGLVTSISPDGQQLAMAIQNGLLWTTADIYLTDWTGHVVHTLWEDDPDDRKDSRPLWSPDGKSIAWHHNYTRGAMSKTVYFGVGLARRDGEKGWRSELQPSREPRVTPLAWSPDSSGLLCARFSPETTQVELFIMDGRFQVQRELFGLDVPGWQPGQRDLARLRDFGRLADWARIPGEIVLPEGEGL